MGIRRVTSSAPLLTWMMRVGISFLKSACDTDDFVSILNRMSMKLVSKFDSCMRIETES